MHARGSGEAARRAKRVPLPFRAISHARGHLRVSCFARRTTEKRETARSLGYWDVLWNLRSAYFVPTSHRIEIVFSRNHKGKEIIVTQVRFQARINE